VYNENRTMQRVLLAAAGLVVVVAVGSAVYGQTGGTAGATVQPKTAEALGGEQAVGGVPVVLSSTALNDTEAAGAVFMIEEEKLARDVYLTLSELWGLRIFANIASAEQSHMDAVLTLIDAYGLVDPVGDNAVGVFVNPELQSLYDDLIATGSTTPVAALEVGAVIEEVDIEDLQTYLSESTQSDVTMVYERLLSGSENHLRAFVSQLESNGVDRAPVVLDESTYDAILSSATSSGGHGQGQGEGQKGGRGPGRVRSAGPRTEVRAAGSSGVELPRVYITRATMAPMARTTPAVCWMSGRS